MSDELDSLTDRELSEIFAVEVAGWTMELANHPIFGVFAYRVTQEITEGYVLAKFATSADAVLPFLVRYYDSWIAMPSSADRVLVSTDSDHGEPSGTYGESATFARATCIALILDKRSRKGQA